MAERQGVSAVIGQQLLSLQQRLFELWHRCKDGRINRLQLQEASLPIRQGFEQGLQRVIDLGCQRSETTPWAKTVRTCRQLLKQKDALWTFLKVEGVEPTNNAAERSLRQAVIQRKISHGVQSAIGALCRSRLLTVVTTLRQHRRDIWPFLEQAWIAHHRSGVMPSLLPEL